MLHGSALVKRHLDRYKTQRPGTAQHKDHSAHAGPAEIPKAQLMMQYVGVFARACLTPFFSSILYLISYSIVPHLVVLSTT